MTCRKIILFFWGITLCFRASAQVDSLPWIKDFTYSISYFSVPGHADSIRSKVDSHTGSSTSDLKQRIAFYLVQATLESYYGSQDTSLYYLEKLTPYVLATDIGEVVTRLYWSIGRIYYLRSEFSTAIEYFLKQDYYAEKYHLKKEQMRAGYYISSCFLEMRNFPVSQYYMLRSTKIAFQNKDTFNLIRCIFSLTNNFSASGNVDSGMYYINQSRRFIKEDDLENLSYYYSLKGNLYSYKKDFASARSFQQVALKMFETTNDSFGLQQVTENLGLAYLSMGKIDSASIYLKKAEELNGNERYGNSITLYDGLYRLYNVKKNHEMALNYLEKWVKQDSAVRKYDIDYIHQLKDSFTLEKNTLILANEKKSIQALYSQRTKFNTYISIAIFGIFVLFILLLYYRYKNKKEKERNLIISQLNEIKMRAFQSQMNPHFVFNCLATIDSYILQNRREEASLMMENFARLIRTVLENSKHDWVELQYDLKALRTYLELEKIRANGSFVFDITYDSSIDHLFVPPLIIQPLVENAIIHGVREIKDGEIKINLGKEGNYIAVEIIDNGKGRNKNREIGSANKSPLGTSVTEDRLRLMDSNTRPEYISYTDLVDPTGTIVKIFIPYRTKQDLT